MSNDLNIQCACGANCACSPCVCPPVREEAAPKPTCGCGAACSCGLECRCDS